MIYNPIIGFAAPGTDFVEFNTSQTDSLSVCPSFANINNSRSIVEWC